MESLPAELCAMIGQYNSVKIFLRIKFQREYWWREYGIRYDVSLYIKYYNQKFICLPKSIYFDQMMRAVEENFNDIIEELRSKKFEIYSGSEIENINYFEEPFDTAVKKILNEKINGFKNDYLDKCLAAGETNIISKKYKVKLKL